VITGPGDNTTAVEGRRDGHLRASHADREQVIGILKAAFVQGRLTEDELDARVDQVYASRAYAERRAAGIRGAQPPPSSVPALKAPKELSPVSMSLAARRTSAVTFWWT
jgi:hypothetical protein